ncbi:hypothetical protein TWF281_001414 [Arthrobotrys megalospora]
MDTIPPNLGSLVGRKRASSNDIRWWVQYVNLPKQPRYRKYLILLSLKLGYGCMYAYIVGLIITRAVLRSDRVDLTNLLVLGVLTMPLSLLATVLSDAAEVEFLWVVKWSLLHHHSLNLKEIEAIIDGDRGLQALKNLFIGPIRTKILAFYWMLIHLGPRLFLALLTSSYEIRYSSGVYYHRIDWGCLAGGLLGIIGIQSIITATWIALVNSHPFIPPNSSMALSLAFRQCLSPLSSHGSLATASKIVTPLSSNPDAKYQLQSIPFRYVSAAQFVLSPSNTARTPTPDDLQRLQPSSFRNFKAIVIAPAIISLLLACTLHQVIQTNYITGGSQPQPLSGLGSLDAKFVLSILLQTYSLFLTSFSSSVINTIRWATFASSHYSLIDIESLLAGNNLWTHWNFWEFNRGSLRGILTSWTTILLNRVLVGLVGWAALMRYYNNLSGGNTSPWETAASVILWVSLGLVVFMWIAASGSLSRGVMVPHDNSLARAILFREVVEELEKGDVGEVRYGSVEVPGGRLRAVFSQEAKEFKPGVYL